MKTKIEKVLIFGLGGVGTVIASAILDSKSAELKVLIDKSRWGKYTSSPTVFNGKKYTFDYVLPDNSDFKADLIIIATKNNGLNSAIQNIKNFVSEETVIISLLNGVNSEKKIAEFYNPENILYSFYIGGSCIKNGRNITQTGNYNVVTGLKYDFQKEILKNLDDFLTRANINHYVSDNFFEEYWKKFFINVGVNQICAVTNKTLNEIRQDKNLVKRMKTLMKEAELVAEKEGIKNHQEIFNSAVNFLLYESDNFTPSMLQDIRNNKQTEVDIFAGHVIKLAEKYNIKVPENKKIYEYIKNLNLN